MTDIGLHNLLFLMPLLLTSNILRDGMGRYLQDRQNTLDFCEPGGQNKQRLLLAGNPSGCFAALGPGPFWA